MGRISPQAGRQSVGGGVVGSARFTYGYDPKDRLAALRNPQNQRTSLQYDAAAHWMDYLLTWNCTHIANAALREPFD